MLIRRLKYGALGIVGSLIMLAAMAMGGIGTAFADSPSGSSFSVNAGTLSESAPAVSINGGNGLTLDGADHTVSLSMPITVVDPTGTGNGWNVTIEASSFSTGGSSPQSLRNLPSVSAVSVADATGSTDTDPTDNQTYVGGLSILSTPVILFSAAANTGMGKFTLTPTMTLKIQANDYQGSYSSTFTVAINSGPGM